MERWERRAKKLRRRREGMQVTGAGVKKVLLPLIQKRAEEAEAKGEAKPRRKRRKRS